MKLQTYRPDPSGVPQFSEPARITVADDQNGLSRMWSALRRRKLSLLFACVLGLAAGLMLAMVQTPSYRARTSIEIQNLNHDFLNMRDLDPTASSGNTSGAYMYLQTQMELLQSESLLERVLLKMGASPSADSAPPRPVHPLVARWNKLMHLPEARPTSEAKRRVAEVKRDLRVVPVQNANLVELYYQSANPDEAALFLNTLTREFIDRNLRARWEMTQETGKWMLRQLSDLKTKLESSERELQAYSQATGLMFTQERVSISEERLRQLQQELSRVEADRIAKQSQFDLAQSGNPEALPAILDNGPLREYQVKLADLRRQLAEMSALYMPTHYKVERLQAQINDLEATLQKERANVLTRIRNEFDQARTRESLIAGAYKNQSARVSDDAAKSIRYNTLKREVDSNRTMYEEMSRKVREAGVISTMRASNVRVVDPAEPPALPYKPDVPFNAALGLFAGLLAGLTFALVRESTNRSISAPGNTSLYLRVPELGVIPSSPNRLSLLSRSGSAASVLQLNGRDTNARRFSRGQIELASWEAPLSSIADSFRGIMTSLIFTEGKEGRFGAIAVSSAHPREGKTTVACNLAIALARTGKRVLLVDGDGRAPRIGPVFGLPSNEDGLSELLASPGGMNPGRIDSCIRQTHIPGLLVLTAGSHPEATVSHLYSSRVPELFAYLTQQYDAVLIDTPPLMLVPDGRVFARWAGRVILVIRSEKTNRESAQVVEQRLAEDGTVLLGTVLNDWSASSDSYGYRYTGASR